MTDGTRATSSMPTDETDSSDMENPIPTPALTRAVPPLYKGSPQEVAGTTYHSRLSEIFREKIYSREWKANSKIPSEHQLMDQYGLSRGTVRHAIKTLVDEGLLVQRHGKGTFVTEFGISHPAGIRPISFAQSLRDQGKDFITLVLDKKVLPAPADVARELEMGEGDEALFLRRVRLVEGVPLICQESWTNLAVCPGYEKVRFEESPPSMRRSVAAGRGSPIHASAPRRDWPGWSTAGTCAATSRRPCSFWNRQFGSPTGRHLSGA